MRILFDFVYSIQTPGVRSVVLYCSCLSGNIQKLLHPGDRGAQHKGRGQAEHVWAGELEPPWFWTESHASCNIDLDAAYSLRVDDGEIGRKKNQCLSKDSVSCATSLGSQIHIQY